MRFSHRMQNALLSAMLALWRVAAPNACVHGASVVCDRLDVRYPIRLPFERPSADDFGPVEVAEVESFLDV